MERPALLSLLVAVLVATGCYRSHTRSVDARTPDAAVRDGASPDAAVSDAATVDANIVPWCVIGDPTFRCEPNTRFATRTAQIEIAGMPYDACLCASSGCTARNGCTTQYLAGDDQHLVCSEHVPVLVVKGGICVRQCTLSADCPDEMACLSLFELYGERFVIDGACFYVAPAASTPAT
jgi:hypothetical protein